VYSNVQYKNIQPSDRIASSKGSVTVGTALPEDEKDLNSECTSFILKKLEDGQSPAKKKKKKNQ